MPRVRHHVCLALETTLKDLLWVAPMCPLFPAFSQSDYKQGRVEQEVGFIQILPKCCQKLLLTPKMILLALVG